MNKIHKVIFLFLLMFYHSSIAQQKGQWQIGIYATGRLRTIYPNTIQELQDKAITLCPNVGVWLSNTTQIGMSFPFGFGKRYQNYFQNNLVTNTRLGPAIYLQQQFFTTRVRPFALVQLSYNQVKTKWQNSSGKTGEYSSFKPELQLGIGVKYLVGNHLTLELMASYNPIRASDFDSKFRSNFGVQYCFSRRMK